MGIEFRYLLKSLALPPTLFIVVIPSILLFGYILCKRVRSIIFVLLIVNILCFWILSTPAFALWVTQHYNQSIDAFRLYDTAATNKLSQPRSIVYKNTNAQAVVVLGGGRDVYAPEYPLGQQLSEQSILRTYYASFLAKHLKLPILASGGAPLYKGVSEAQLMNVLLNNLGISATWQDTRSLNTEQNAQFTANILQAEGINHIILVSSAYHLKRALRLFEAQGFEVELAPTDFYGLYSNVTIPWFRKWLPDIEALQQSRQVLHEILGQWYYDRK